MEERIGPGRPKIVSSAALQKTLTYMTKMNYEGARTITNRYYVLKATKASSLAVGVPAEPSKYRTFIATCRQKWPFVWGQRIEGNETEWGEELHWSLLQEIGRWEDPYKIVKMMDTIEAMEFKNVKRAISFSRQCRTGKHNSWESITETSEEDIRATLFYNSL